MTSTDETRQQEAADTVARVVNESTLVVLAKGAGMVLGFVATFVLGRWFGPEALGRYSLARTVVMVATLVTVLGFHQGLAKYLPRFRNAEVPTKLATLTRTAATYTTLLAVLAAAGLWLSRELLAVRVFDDAGMGRALWWAALIVVPFTVVRVFSGLYRGVKSFGIYALVKQAGLRLVLVAGLLAAWALGWVGAGGALGAYFVAATLAAIWCVVYARNFDLEFAPLFLADEPQGRELQREVLAFSATMIFVGGMHFLMRRVDILMAGVFLESARVGIYRLAVTVSVFAGFFLQASNAVFSAFISELFDAGDQELLQKTYSAITRWVVTLTLPIVVSFWMFPEPIVGFFGREYLDGAVVLQILSLGAFSNIVVGSTGYLLVMGDQERLQLINNALVALLNTGLNWVLIPRFGITGAAVATALSMLAIAVVRVTEIHLLFDLFPWNSTFVSVVLAGGLMLGLAFALRPWVEGVPAVVLVTAANLGLGLAATYWFRTDLDHRLFSRASARVRRLLSDR